MLHQPAKTFVAAPPATPPAHSPDDIKSAKAWIAAARRCGLVVAPYRTETSEGGVMTSGQDEMIASKTFSAANDRFRRHPAHALYATLPTATIFAVLCQDFGVDPADPQLCAKVNRRLRGEAEERQRVDAERKLLSLCKNADPILRENERLENSLSEVSDAFGKVRKTFVPTVSGFPVEYNHLSYAELKEKLHHWRDTAEGQANTYFAALIATGRFRQLLRERKTYEAEMRALRAVHGLTAAEKAAHASTARLRATIAEIAATPATNPHTLAAKCRVMKLCRATGWSCDDEFEALSLSIIDDGARLDDTPCATRPPRSGSDQHVHH